MSRKTLQKQERIAEGQYRRSQDNTTDGSDPNCPRAESLYLNEFLPASDPPSRRSSSDNVNRIYRNYKVKDKDTESISNHSMLDESPAVGVEVNRRGSRLLEKVRRFSRVNYLKNRLVKSVTQETYVKEDPSTLDELVCYMKDNPYKIHKCAQNGNAKEVARILQSDPSRLHVRNSQGQMPIHLAALKGHVNVIETLLDHSVDLDAQDKDGNTALHISTKESHNDVISLLLTNGAKPDILNHCHMAPIHIAAEEGHVDVVKNLLSHKMDVNTLGEQGQTAMHYAAAKDHGEVMRALMTFGGKPCQKDDHGYYPIHIAAKCAAADAMEAIIEQALTKGYTRESILNFKDRENNLPLHAAVNGGDIKAVRVCLKAGASVKSQQDDGSTPVHFACAQGNMEMITMMESMQSDNFLTAVFTEDVMKMTPLHRAALFDHDQVMKCLLGHGADIDSKDASGRTPLLLAASKGCWSSVQMLISHKADVHVKDKNNRNFLHLAIRFGGKLEQIGGHFIQDIKTLQNERDNFGCTPLHYASKEGHLLALDDLIRMGAVINPKNNDKQSPLHFGARYGRYNTCRRLLDSVHGANIINETDGSGLTALHIAAQNGHTKVIQLLLARGAVINKDHENSTPLHHAAANGWTHSMKILVGVRANLIDVSNIHGDTALHVAAKEGQTSSVSLLLTMGAELSTNVYELTFMDYIIQNKHQDVAMATVRHDRWEEVMGLCSKLYGCVFLGLIQQLPDVCMSVLNRCQTHSEDDPRSSNYHITYNFSYMEVASGCISKVKDPTSDFTTMLALKKMVENNRVQCLSHPVCDTFLKAKWSKYGCIVYTVYLLIYAMFLACLTAFIVNHNSLKHFDRTDDNKTQEYLHGNKAGDYHYDVAYKFTLLFIVVYSGANIIKEVIQIITQKRRYFSDFQNYVEWSLYVSTLVFVLPFVHDVSYHWQWEGGAIAVFLAWFNCLVFLQRFDFFGIYVVMFLEILNTLLQVLAVFSILIIAFGISFFLLLHNEESKAYSTPGLALLRTFMMMLELDYMVSFNEQFVDGDDKTLHFGSLTLTMLTVFVLLMPILLMNLLIGLAVGDIESVQRNARLKRMAMQVQLHADMEAKMPVFLLKRAAIFELVHYPNTHRGKINWFCNALSGMGLDSQTRDTEGSNAQNCFLYEEMYRQKVRMREMSSTLEKNNLLLRKIMQKMEIHTEDEAWDEGAEHDSGDEFKPGNTSRVNGSSIKRKLQLKSAVISAWQKGHNK